MASQMSLGRMFCPLFETFEFLFTSLNTIIGSLNVHDAVLCGLCFKLIVAVLSHFQYISASMKDITEVSNFLHVSLKNFTKKDIVNLL